MVKSHLNRINAPRTWSIKRKENVFITRPDPSGHTLEECMPLNVIIKEFLGLAKTTKEVRDIVYNKEVMVDGKRRKRIAYGVGLFDIVEIPEINKAYRMLFNNKGKLVVQEIEAKEKHVKPRKIIKKTTLKKARMQLNFNDGCNIIVDKDNYNVGDVAIMNIKENKITDHLTFEKGNYVYFTGGKQIGKYGRIEKVEKEIIAFKTDEGMLLETAKEYAFIIGKNTPVIAMVK
ncbi:30S ribosomal protein S4e [Candidatus Woesearchaeota archaeon]|nr:30S ribosomal protein S4e [Candidatus Woesearchaeota archaeon]